MKASVPKRFNCPDAPITHPQENLFRLSFVSLSVTWPLDHLLNLQHRLTGSSVLTACAAGKTYSIDFRRPSVLAARTACRTYSTGSRPATGPCIAPSRLRAVQNLSTTSRPDVKPWPRVSPANHGWCLDDRDPLKQQRTRACFACRLNAAAV